MTVKKKVLVIDDSALMRRKISMILQEEDYDVRTARDGQDGFEQAQTWQPDVITLDINMPVMDGITCLSMIMEAVPCPVVMVSSLTEKGALATFEALELGAVDYVAKPGGTVSVNIDVVADELKRKVRAALRAKVRRPRISSSFVPKPATTVVRPAASACSEWKHLVLVGVSTGGPSTLEVILKALPADFPCPIIIAQHMPAKFTAVFAARLNSLCALEVIHVESPQPIQAGKVYIARGEADCVVARRAGKLMVVSVPVGNYLWHPSVDKLVESALSLVPAQQIIGVQLTGMGNDGAKPMAQLFADGGRTIAEAEQSAVVFGMPKELIALGGATKVLANHDIAAQLIRWSH